MRGISNDEALVEGISPGRERRFALGNIVTLERDADGNITIRNGDSGAQHAPRIMFSELESAAAGD